MKIGGCEHFSRNNDGSKHVYFRNVNITALLYVALSGVLNDLRTDNPHCTTLDIDRHCDHLDLM